MRALLRRQLWRVPTRTLRLLRTQHNYPPHKEYFQNPGQRPLPDYTPPVASFAPAGFASEPSRLRRLLRSTLWTVLFGALGVVTGTGVITWEYLQPLFEPGSTEDNEMMQDVLDMLDSHPLVETLREDKWIEEQFYVQRPEHEIAKGLELVKENLVGTRGISIVSTHATRRESQEVDENKGRIHTPTRAIHRPCILLGIWH